MNQNGENSMINERRFLWLLPKWPLPARDGARVANVNLLKGLTALGIKIDVVVVAGMSENCNVNELKRVCGVQDVFIVKKKEGRVFFKKPWLAITLKPFAEKKVTEEIQNILNSSPNKWGALVYDGLHVAAHSQKGGSYVPPHQIKNIYYRAHNVESEIWHRKADITKFLPLKWLFKMQARLMQKFETSLVSRARATLTVSDRDFDHFKKRTPLVKGGAVPIGYDFSEGPKSPREPLSLLFIAKLDWPPNRDGLIWFLDHVWPKTQNLRPDLKLIIAGSGDSSWVNSKLGPGTEFLGSVESVIPLYEKAGLCIVPIFYGSGTRVKAIEASRFGRAVLSTALGVEGLDLTPEKNYFRAESAEEWSNLLTNFTTQDVNAVGMRAYEKLKGTFNLPEAARQLLHLIDANGYQHSAEGTGVNGDNDDQNDSQKTVRGNSLEHDNSSGSSRPAPNNPRRNNR